MSRTSELWEMIRDLNDDADRLESKLNKMRFEIRLVEERLIAMRQNKALTK